MFPIGNMTTSIRSTKELGDVIRTVRKALGVTQDQLALTSGTNRRFIIELEQGKPTAQAGKVLQVLRTLGIDMSLAPPPGMEPPNGTPTAEETGHGPAA